MSIPHPIPYQGSKRGLAQSIIAYLPPDVERLIEPFAGSAAISLATAYYRRASAFVLNDINSPLMQLWDAIINRPQEIVRTYQHLWYEQLDNERTYYDQVRAKFNTTQQPEYLLYLLARCVKASVRYNAIGEFNQSPDNRRKGAKPSTMAYHIHGASSLLKHRTILFSLDYREVIKMATPADVIYMDPPYQGVSGQRDQRYVEKLTYEDFVESLELLNDNDTSYIVSYDGRTGQKQHGALLPDHLHLKYIELKVGRSSQATLLGRAHHTYESLYLSSALQRRLGTQRPEPVPSLFEVAV